MTRRNWAEARAKVDAEDGCCRICGSPYADAAHVIPRGLAGTGHMGADDVVGLCREHHTQYDAHTLNLLPYLRISEQLAAVSAAGGIGLAYRRTTNQRELP